MKGKGSPYSITERTDPAQIPVLGSQAAGDTIGTVPVPWAGHFQCNFVKQHSETVVV